MRLRFIFIIVVLIVIVSGGGLQAETTDDAGLWLLALGQGSFSDAESSKMRWWVDLQARFSDDANGFNQSIVRPGIGFATGKRTTLWLGYAWIRNSPGVGDDFDEHRIWQQFTWSALPRTVDFSSRTRLEQRFRDDGNDTGWRFRQFFKLVYSLPDKPNVSLVAYDELFFSLNDTDWGVESGFDRNRLFLGVGWGGRSGEDLRTRLPESVRQPAVGSGSDGPHRFTESVPELLTAMSDPRVVAEGFVDETFHQGRCREALGDSRSCVFLRPRSSPWPATRSLRKVERVQVRIVPIECLEDRLVEIVQGLIAGQRDGAPYSPCTLAFTESLRSS